VILRLNGISDQKIYKRILHEENENFKLQSEELLYFFRYKASALKRNKTPALTGVVT